MTLGLIRCASAAGVKRDGTQLDGHNYSDATWCRFQRSLPRKIGGYQVVSQYLSGLSRNLLTQSQNGSEFYSSGWAGGLDALQVPGSGLATFPIQRALPGFTPDPTNTWQFDVQFDNDSGQNLLFAFAGQNLINPAANANFDVYWGNVYDGSAMTTLASVNPDSGLALAVSGGLVSLAPYLILYGNDGYFAWSRPGFPLDFTSTANPALTGATRITSQKIIRGIPLRAGGGYSPAGLFWSVDSLLRATFVGITNTTWQFDSLTTESSVLSDRSIIEYDGAFFWAGVDRFLTFNGVVAEVPNDLNLNWFYEGINKAYASKCFAMKFPRWGEIWWCYPRGSATECSHAVIYNVREKTWYDTPLPNSGRSAGYRGDSLVGGLMSGVLPNRQGLFNLWRHDVGTNEVSGSSVVSVPSSFTTEIYSDFNQQPPSDDGITIQNLQPDFVLSGNLTVTPLKRNNANSPEYAGDVATIYNEPSNPLLQITPLKESAKMIRLKFESNQLGGDYQMGQTMMEIGPDSEKDL